MRTASSLEIVRDRIRALLDASPDNQRGLAMYCRKSQSWVSKILKAKRNLSLRDIDAVAGFFNMTAPQLLTLPDRPLLYPDRRTNKDRRHGAKDRRVGRERRTRPATGDPSNDGPRDPLQDPQVTASSRDPRGETSRLDDRGRLGASCRT
jgi:transcriptional regulator with XRE-family HTH domain